MTGTALPPLPDLQTATIDGRTLAWREAGQGDPLVLVHGIGGNSATWRRQLAFFADSFRTIAWDAPGYGGSDPVATPTVDQYAGALAALLRKLGVATPHLVGHSLGSIMAASACRNHGVAARSLALLQPVTGMGMLPDEARERIRQARIADMRKLGPKEFALQRGRNNLGKQTPPAVIGEALTVMQMAPQDGYLAAWDMMCGADIFPLLEPGTRPTLVVCGSDDPVCPPATAQRIADAIDGVLFRCIDGIGHLGPIEAPERLNPMLADFFAGRLS